MSDTIEQLDELHAATTQGELECRRFEGVTQVGPSMTIDDWRFCCDIHNAWPVISEEIKRLRDEKKQLQDAMQELLDFSDNLHGTHFARSMRARFCAGALLNPETKNQKQD